MGQTFSCHYCEGDIPLAGQKPGGRATCPHCGVQADVPHSTQPKTMPYAPPTAQGEGPFAPPQSLSMDGSSHAANEAGNTAMLLGILSLVICALLGPIAIVKGNEAKRHALNAGIPTPGSATAGLVLGWITTIMFVGSLAFMCLFLGLGVVGASM